MKTLVLNVSDKAYKKLKKAADELYAELYDGKDMECRAPAYCLGKRSKRSRSNNAPRHAYGDYDSA